jgi:hypothetical protein
VEGLCSAEVTSGREMSEYIDGATGNREVRATKMNDESSRSHLIFMVRLQPYIHLSFSFHAIFEL